MSDPNGKSFSVEHGINDLKMSEHGQFGPKIVDEDGSSITIEVKPGKTYRLAKYP